MGTGLINNSVVTEAEGDNFFEELIASFSALELDSEGRRGGGYL